MSGQKGGLLSYFQTNTDNFLYGIHCMAHRLELAIVKAMKTVNYFENFETFVNNLFQFYNLNNSKRKSHLKETAKLLNKKMHALNYIYHVRWISPELQSSTNLKTMWLVLMKDLQFIEDNLKFDQKTRTLADKLASQFRGKNFLVILHFLSDVLHTLSFWSLKM